MYIYIYMYIYLYMYLYIYICLLASEGFTFFSKHKTMKQWLFKHGSSKKDDATSHWVTDCSFNGWPLDWVPCQNSSCLPSSGVYFPQQKHSKAAKSHLVMAFHCFFLRKKRLMGKSTGSLYIVTWQPWLPVKMFSKNSKLNLKFGSLWNQIPISSDLRRTLRPSAPSAPLEPPGICTWRISMHLFCRHWNQKNHGLWIGVEWIWGI